MRPGKVESWYAWKWAVGGDRLDAFQDVRFISTSALFIPNYTSTAPSPTGIMELATAQSISKIFVLCSNQKIFQ